PDHAAQASSGLQIDMLGEEFGHLGLDRLGQQGARSVAQHLGERVAERPWLKQLDDVSIGHGVSLLCWRSGGSNTPTIRRLLPVRPSPTSAYSSDSWGPSLASGRCGVPSVLVLTRHPWEPTWFRSVARTHPDQLR